jgi:hypothetical protein
MASGVPPPPPGGRFGGHLPAPGNLTKNIEGFHNFLAHSAETFLNVKVEEGVADFEMNLEPHTTLIVSVVSDD